MSATPTRFLGRLPSQPDARTLQLRTFRTGPRRSPPPVRRWDQAVNEWGVMGNDAFGNCTTVTAAHALLNWRATELGDRARITDEAVIDQARRIGGLNGFSILDRNRIWQKSGLFGDRLWAYAEFRPTDHNILRAVINDFGCADIGLNMPRAWQQQDVWTTGTGPNFRENTWGPHSVPIVGYDTQYFYIVTWGQIQRITGDAIVTYSDEAYALIDENWIAEDGITASGFDLFALTEAMRAVTAEQRSNRRTQKPDGSNIVPTPSDAS